jgi:soluble lytic murein transglycosylase-like protein
MKKFFFLIYLFFTIISISSFNGIYKAEIIEIQLPKDKDDMEYFHMIPDKYKSICKDIHIYTGITYKIIFNLVQKESNWKERAYNGSNSNKTYDVGLTQVNSSNFEYFYWFLFKLKPSSNLDYKSYYYQPEINLWAGFLYLQYLIKYYKGDIILALQAYNGGLGKVNRGKTPESSKEYASWILTN